MGLTLTQETLNNRLQDLNQLNDPKNPVPLILEVRKWQKELLVDEHGFSSNYFSRVLEIVRENIGSWLELDLDSAHVSLQEKRTSELEGKRALLERSKGIQDDYLKLKEMLSGSEDFKAVSFSERLYEFTNLISEINRILDVGELENLVELLKKWKKSKEDKELKIEEPPEEVPGLKEVVPGEVIFLRYVASIDTFRKDFQDNYTELRMNLCSDDWDQKYEKLKNSYREVELFIKGDEFKKKSEELFKNLENWRRKCLAEDTVLEELPEKISLDKSVIEKAQQRCSEESTWEHVFDNKELVEEGIRALETGCEKCIAMRVLDLSQLFTSVFCGQDCSSDETPGKAELSVSSESNCIAAPGHPYFEIAKENNRLIIGINSVAQGILAQNAEANEKTVSEWKSWSNKEVRPISDCWNQQGSLWKRIIETIKLVLKVYYQYPAAACIWSGRANACNDQKMAEKLHYFAEGYKEFASIEEQLTWICKASENEIDINWNMLRVLHSILDLGEFKEENYRTFTGRDNVTYEEMHDICTWIAGNIDPVKKAMRELRTFYDNATYFALGVIPTTTEAPLDEFKEKTSAVYNACKTFEKKFNKAFPLKGIE